jgi:hypothetical protein
MDDDLSGKFADLGSRVSDTAVRLSRPEELDAARRLLMEAPAPSAPRRLRPLALAAAAVLALAIAVVAILRPRDRISFVVGSPPSAGVVGEWVAADRSAPLPMRFSEQTSLVLSAGARARVTETTARGATVVLEQGNVTAAVTHVDGGTRWTVQAGPFEVRVTGTRFDASWDPAGDTFVLTMHEGSVVVSGPMLPAERAIVAGERLRVSIRDGSMELRTASTATSAASAAPPAGEPAKVAAAPEAPPAPSAPPEAAPPPPATSAAAPPPPREPTWHDLAAAGRYDEALAAADRAGFAQEIERASSKDLAVLADAARYGSRPALARQALLAQRRRFGVRGPSAFLLGKIAADQQGASGDAVTWFETYLSEEPNGALAEQALGRILEIRRRDPAAARATAERYLARWPNGPHAPLARSLLSP